MKYLLQFFLSFFSAWKLERNETMLFFCVIHVECDNWVTLWNISLYAQKITENNQVSCLLFCLVNPRISSSTNLQFSQDYFVRDFYPFFFRFIWNAVLSYFLKEFTSIHCIVQYHHNRHPHEFHIKGKLPRRGRLIFIKLFLKKLSDQPLIIILTLFWKKIIN